MNTTYKVYSYTGFGAEYYSHSDRVYRCSQPDIDDVQTIIKISDDYETTVLNSSQYNAK